jgi:fructokinase
MRFISGTLLYGLILFDIIQGEKYIGGPAINIALHMACHNFNSTLVSCVGDDELGLSARKLLENHGVSTDFVSTSPDCETGWVKVLLDDCGNPSFEIIKPVAYDFISLSTAQIVKLTQATFDIFYFGTVVQRNSTSADTLKRLIKEVPFKEIFFDINLRPGHYTKDVVDFSLSYTNILKLNEGELQLIGELFELGSNDEQILLNWVFKKYPTIKTILLTRGENGASVYVPGCKKDFEGIKVKVKDTVGSGDAFSAGFIMEYLKSGDIYLAAEKGNALGAYVATKSGAVPELEEKMHEIID